MGNRLGLSWLPDLSGGAAIALAAAAAVVLGAIVVWRLVRSRASPAERERKRRLGVNATGRVSDANIVDYRDGALHYSYSAGGAEYTAAQDVSGLQELLPPDPATLIGPGSVKYVPNNPANSIVVCEQWSGLRVRHRAHGA
jgi:hypothetical protein